MKATARIAALAGVLVATNGGAGRVPEGLRIGVWVRVEATIAKPRTVVADAVEIAARPEDEEGLTAVIEAVDPDAKALTALGIKIVTSDATMLDAESHEPISFSALQPGRRVSAKGTFRDDRTLVASRLRLKAEKAEKTREAKLEGRVQQVDSAGHRFTVLGIALQLTPQTKIEGPSTIRLSERRDKESRGGGGERGEITDAPRGEAPPSVPHYGVIWKGRLTRSGEPSQAGWTWLRSQGARAVVNFQVRADDEASMRTKFEHYLSLPLKDKQPPTEAQAETFLAFVRDPHHWPVHIHCKGGEYRTGLMAALVRYAIDGWSIDEASPGAGRSPKGKDMYARTV